MLRVRIKTQNWRQGDKIPSIRVLSREYGCSASTIRKALDLLEIEGYITRIERRGIFVATEGMKDTPPRIVAAVVVSVDSPTWSAAIHGMEKILNMHNYDLIVASHALCFEKQKAILERLIAKRVMGFILSPVDLLDYEDGNNAILELILKSGAKIVFLDRTLKNIKYNIPYITSDSVHGGYRATRYLIEHGHSRILFVRNTSSSASQERWLGYKLALDENKIPYDEALTITIGEIDETLNINGHSQLMEYLGNLRYTAVFTVNDELAAAVLSCLEKLGRQVPRDVSLVTYDARELDAVTNCKVAGMSQPFFEMGERCAKILLDEIENTPGDGATGYIYASTFRRGESVAKNEGEFNTE